MPAAETLAVEQVWELSKLWYRDRLSPEYAGRSAAQAVQIFEKMGLTSGFWRFEE